MKPKPSLLAAIAVLCIAAGAGWAQYVEDSVSIGDPWVTSLAYNSREDVVYGSCESGAFFAIECSTNTLVASHSLGAQFICFDSLDNRAYCTTTDSNGDALAVIDGRTHSRIKVIPMTGSWKPVWDRASNRVYVSCFTTRSVAVVDCASDSLLTYIPVGFEPFSMYINNLRHKLYVLNSGDHTVSIVDMATDTVVKTVEGGGDHSAGYYCRSLDRFYCSGEDGKVTVIDGCEDSVEANIRAWYYGDVSSVSGSDARDVVLACVHGGGSRICTINAATNEVDTLMEARGIADAIYWSPLSDRFYCPSDHSGEVVVLSGDGRQLLASLPVASWPSVIAASPIRKRLYIGHVDGPMVYVIRDASTASPEGQPCKPDTVPGLRIDPNPFRDRVSITSGMGVASGALRVYSEDGRLVRSLNATKAVGKVLRLTWNGRDDSGVLLPPGVYVIEAGPGLRAKVVKLK